MEEIAALRFRHAWRPYQARVLAELERHFTDRRLHLVAAPGSGKTVMGLELFRRLGRPAVIFSPTRVVRDQWLARLGDFLPAGAGPVLWTSRRLESPGLLTSVTYQALHSRMRAGHSSQRAPQAADIQRAVGLLEKAGVATVILDEAHHLRREWWRALSILLGGLKGVTLISLTATPPYDALGAEWARYEQLCGPIDEEVSVPELVKSHTLCPHQDYIWAVTPTRQDSEALGEYELRAVQVCRELGQDDLLKQVVQRHAWMTGPLDAAALLEAPEFVFALLIYLKEFGLTPPAPVLNLLGCRPEDLPAMDRRWWQALVHGYMFGPGWPDDQATAKHRSDLAGRLRRLGLIRHRAVLLQGSPKLQRRLAQTATKIEACPAIVRLEREFRGEDLRQVILTDYIRDSPQEASQLGAWPIFEKLIETLPAPQRQELALLTGRLAAIPACHLETLQEVAVRSVAGVPLRRHPDYLEVRSSGHLGGLVAALTTLLEEGRIRVLVGTRSLLGEGWDAPAVNSLILASFSGSFMLTNQMRGRAIRRDPRAPLKASSIWHLTAVDWSWRSAAVGSE